MKETTREQSIVRKQRKKKPTKILVYRWDTETNVTGSLKKKKYKPPVSY